MTRTHDDDKITLGDGKIRVQSEGGFVELVSGSRVIRRTPHGLSPDAEDRMAARQTTVLEIPPGHLWCSWCGCVRPQDYFDRDASRTARGGFGYVCKDCENPVDRERKRKKRRADAAVEGREVRRYTRRHVVE